MPLRDAGLAAYREYIDSGSYDGAFHGAFRTAIPFEYKGVKYVFKYDSNTDYGDEECLGSCQNEFRIWQKFADTEHRKILCPILDFGSIDDESDWVIMPRLRTLYDIHPGGRYDKRNEREEYFKKYVEASVQRLYPQAYREHLRIYLPKGLLGDDLHWNNWGYDPYDKQWKVIDYGGDDDPWVSDWESNFVGEINE